MEDLSSEGEEQRNGTEPTAETIKEKECKRKVGWQPLMNFMVIVDFTICFYESWYCSHFINQNKQEAGWQSMFGELTFTDQEIMGRVDSVAFKGSFLG